jgi:hypothetical protein
MASSWSIIKWAYRRYTREKLDAYWRGYVAGSDMANELRDIQEREDHEEIAALERAFTGMKDMYGEVSRALGFQGDGFWGDPYATHEEIVERAHELREAAKAAA